MWNRPAQRLAGITGINFDKRTVVGAPEFLRPIHATLNIEDDDKRIKDGISFKINGPYRRKGSF